ncbi:MAG TPA: HNH endonuclease [Kofleriaceae bacterium]|nr:HNH endonuclease [Kofleriaceae bacterium]
MPTLSPIIISRLEKAATDNGFDQALDPDGKWLVLASTQCPLRVWLGVFGESVFSAAFSQSNVAAALGEHGTPLVAPLPKGAVAGRSVVDIPSLHRLLRRAFQLSRTLPDELFHAFQKQVATMPRVTEIERLEIQRVGQDLFRQGLVDFWDGSCAVTGLTVPELLRASHIKPWADCATDAERLDVHNGLLLSPNLDLTFDRGFITFADGGDIVISPALGADAQAALGIHAGLRAHGIADGHRAYLPWHREHIYRGDGG